uniref:Vitellogenin-1-like n=1 Tax=Phascolarctos cinereus TaxID=38626 RepID=A0A6P5J9Y1_PHACI|nr:vitellogenin-1-like [Phascolarctos cinereus]
MKIGISGRCNTTYFIKEDKKYNLAHVTKSKDLNDCKESVQMHTGFAYAVKCKECKPITFRSLFLDIIPAVASLQAMKFLRLKTDQQELNAWETFQSVLLTLHFCTTTQEAVDEAKLILKNTQSHPWDILRITGFLAYGSLVYKHCAKSMNCSESPLQVSLLTFLSSTLFECLI